LPYLPDHNRPRWAEPARLTRADQALDLLPYPLLTRRIVRLIRPPSASRVDPPA
jgi:hypothetical protein